MLIHFCLHFETEGIHDYIKFIYSAVLLHIYNMLGTRIHVCVFIGN